MSKNKKKNKQKMSAETKAKITLGFKTLISNDACIKTGREWHWYLPIIFGILSVIIALIPSFTTNMKTKYGTSMLGSATYGYENGLVHFQNFMEEKGVDFVVKDSTLVDTDNKWTSTFSSEDQKWYTVKNADSNKTIFEVFFNDYEKHNDKNEELSDYDFYARVVNNKNPYTDIARGGEKDKYSSNALVLGKKTIYVFKVKADASSSSVINGIYDRSEGLHLKNLAPTDVDKNTIEYAEKLKLSYASFLNDCAETQKNTQSWTYCGIMAAVYVGLEFLFGLVIFLMTRGKRNPFRIYTFWETQKMAYWASVSPAILSLIVGFLLPQFAMMGFIFLFGLRIMWMSMRSLRPYEGK